MNINDNVPFVFRQLRPKNMPKKTADIITRLAKAYGLEDIGEIDEQFLNGFTCASEIVIAQLEKEFESDNVGMSMSHRAIAKVIDDYIANNKGNIIKQYTAYEVKKLLISDDSDNKGEWIPVFKRLPKPYEIVIRTVKDIGWNGTSRIYVDFGSICPIDTDVIAWQPLPKPYKAESEDKPE